ncbi:MAG: hypothetical protein K2J39_00620, partial [Ruminococcus sp.]|nr:hypothetical protein [Ruminococcus sp.]
YKGERFEVKTKLVNKNKGKTETINCLWNRTFKTYVPEQWKTSSCEYRKVTVPLDPDWHYYILSVKRLQTN